VLKFWPIVPGPATAGTGVTGTLGVITTNGVKQATYDGHPLYTYVGDTAPGRSRQRPSSLGGLWWVMTPTARRSRRPRPAAAPVQQLGGSSSVEQLRRSSSGGGGYGV